MRLIIVINNVPILKCNMHVAWLHVPFRFNVTGLSKLEKEERKITYHKNLNINNLLIDNIGLVNKFEQINNLFYRHHSNSYLSMGSFTYYVIDFWNI